MAALLAAAQGYYAIASASESIIPRGSGAKLHRFGQPKSQVASIEA